MAIPTYDPTGNASTAGWVSPLCLAELSPPVPQQGQEYHDGGQKEVSSPSSVEACNELG